MRGLFLLSLLCGLGFSTIAAAQESAAGYRDQVQKMYIAYYGRPADPEGLNFWAQQLDNNDGDLAAIIDAFGTSADYQERSAGLDIATRLNNIYVNTLGRDADTEGLDFYLEKLDSGDMTLASVRSISPMESSRAIQTLGLDPSAIPTRKIR